jgi:predicted N-acetyltransferase YhbS
MLAYVDGMLISHLGIVERRVVAVGGQPIQLSGIGGVITHPAWRRRGIASAVLEQAVEFIRNELTAEFCLLLCREEIAPLYARFGWKCVEGPTTFQQPVGQITWPRLTMVLPCAGKEWPRGSIDLCGLPW